MNKNLKENLLAKNKWIRCLFMILFLIIFSVAKFLIWLIVAFQFISLLFTNNVNRKLLDFSKNLSFFMYQILQFVTYNSETKPYPFSPWPDEARVIDNQ